MERVPRRLVLAAYLGILLALATACSQTGSPSSGASSLGLSPSTTLAASASATETFPEVNIDPGDSFPDGPPPASFTEPPLPTGPLTSSCAAGTAPDASPQPSLSIRPNARLYVHVPVLEYHRIVPFSEAGDSFRSLVVPPSVFSSQMAALEAAGWHSITAAQLGQDLALGIKPPPKTFVATFDDGWYDGFKYAWPILSDHGFVGTFFVIPGRIGDGKEMTALEMRYLANSGNEIGDHTMWHLPLDRLSDASARYEVLGAAQEIARQVGVWPVTFAYPYGSFAPRVMNIVHSCQTMLMAFTTVQAVQENWELRFATPRIKIGAGVSGPDLVLRLEPFR